VNLLLLFLEFCKIGLFAVGGGLATLPFLFDMAGRSGGRLTKEAVGNFLALANSAPGAIGVNTAAQTGFAAAGVAGAFAAALGLIFPAIVLISVIARMLGAFRANKTVEAVFRGFRPAAAGLLAAAGFAAWRLALFNAGFSVWYEAVRWREAALFALLFAGIRKFPLHPAAYIAFAAAAGVALGL
jgi:chromate transporter